MTQEIVQSSEERDAVVAAYRQAGLGGERYGVVCGIIDEENPLRCNKRICPQGWAAAMKFNSELNSEGKVKTVGLYCLHRENYDGTEPADDITSILNTHGLPWRPLRTLRKMRENKPSKKKGKNSNGKEGQGSPKRSGNDEEDRGGERGAQSSVGLRSAGGYGAPSGEVSGAGAQGSDGPTFAQYLDGKLPPSDGESGRARLFLAGRERRQQEAQERGQGSASEDSN